mgnify:CR=1 FL=1
MDQLLLAEQRVVQVQHDVGRLAEQLMKECGLPTNRRTSGLKRLERIALDRLVPSPCATAGERGGALIANALCAKLDAAVRAALPQTAAPGVIVGVVTPAGTWKAAYGKADPVKGTPMIVGCTDTSAAILLSGNKAGRLLNITGSTDALALCVALGEARPMLDYKEMRADRRHSRAASNKAVA